MSYVYLMYDSTYYKIGHTTKKLQMRLNEIQVGNPNEIMIIDSFHTHKYKELEYMLQKKYKSQRIRGEWFDLTLDDVKNFQTTCKEQIEIIEALKDNPFIFAGH